MSDKKKKLDLDELKVQSFVTAFDVKSGETREIKGGYSEGCQPSYSCGGGGCPSEAPTVCNETLCGCGGGTADTECGQAGCGVHHTDYCSYGNCSD